MNASGEVSAESLPVGTGPPSLASQLSVDASPLVVGKPVISRLSSRVPDDAKHKTQSVQGNLELESVLQVSYVSSLPLHFGVARK